ncbi:MAG: NADH-quinone oxidoreductase subunit J [Gammaproteobacteria bacterium]|jgi:NADH-quinone oxidoreductase subunit J|nr:NADH-quinone oxidoreductase subunit J [Gammaproteobacteria bacterium]
MSFIDFIFYIFAAMLIVAALGVITARNPVHSVLLLVLAFFASSALWILLEAEFLAIVLVLVYVGAVMVLFLFVVMMLDINVEQMRSGFVRYLPIGALVALVLAAQMIWIVGAVGPDILGDESLSQSVRHGADYSNTKELGRLLYTDYVLPFEIAAVILLVAIVAAISLTLRRRPFTKYQTPANQVKVKRNDRLKIMKMDAEAKE